MGKEREATQEADDDRPHHIAHPSRASPVSQPYFIRRTHKKKTKKPKMVEPEIAHPPMIRAIMSKERR